MSLGIHILKYLECLKNRGKMENKGGILKTLIMHKTSVTLLITRAFRGFGYFSPTILCAYLFKYIPLESISNREKTFWFINSLVAMLLCWNHEIRS